MRRRNPLDQGRFLHGLDVPVPRSSDGRNILQGQLDILFLVLRVVAAPQFAPKVVECDLGGRMLTDPAVPTRAVARTLGARICLDSLLLERFAFLPTFGGLEQLARCCNGLLIREQFCMID